MTIHKTVLLDETVDALNLKPGMIVVDATLGGGGHSLKVLEKIGENGKLIAFDRDLDAIDRFRKKVEAGRDENSNNNIFVERSERNDSSVEESISERVKTKTKGDRVRLFHENYSTLKDSLASIDVNSVDAILADLGISSDQLADDARGISFQGDAPLDMRMDLTRGITAADVVNTYSQQDLVKILKDFGDEQYANSIARNIVAERVEKPFSRTSELVELIERSVPGAYKRKKIHPATKTFQALRIEVNQELKTLDLFLSQAVEVLRPGGRLAIITFHSGEDALVKSTFRENARGCICPPEFPVCRCEKVAIINLITSKPIVPSEDEVLENPRSRSAKLRVAEKA